MSAARPSVLTQILPHRPAAARPASTGICIGVLLLGDAAAVFVAAAVSVITWMHFGVAFNPSVYFRIWPVLLLFPLAYAASGLYPGFGRSAVEELRSLTVSTSLVYAALAVTVFLRKDSVSFSRAAFLLAWAQSLILVPAGRALLRLLVAQKPWWGDAVAIVGEPYEAGAVADSLARRARIGLKPAMILDPGRALRITASEGIRHAIVVGSPRINLAELYRNLSDVFPRITVIPDLNGLSCLWAEPRDLGGTLGLEIRQRLLMPWPRAAKRAVDLCILAGAAMVSVPLVSLIAVMIKLNSRGPVFYGQQRRGRGGHPFIAWKFRTMVADAGGVLEQCLQANPALRAEWQRDRKLKRDPRVTVVGRLLRRTSLDELPQLWNVLRGQMSVVGPRPIVSEEIARYGSGFELYKKVPPGLTGLWQVSGRNNLSYEERVECDLYYIRNWSPWLDLYILARTVAAVLLARERIDRRVSKSRMTSRKPRKQIFTFRLTQEEYDRLKAASSTSGSGRISHFVRSRTLPGTGEPSLQQVEEKLDELTRSVQRLTEILAKTLKP